MSSAQDTADAIILVLKKLLKWIFLGALAISAVFFIIFKANEFWDWQTVGRHAEKVSIKFVTLIEGNCEKEYPYMFIIENKSSKTVLETEFSVEIRKKGYSNVINSYLSITESKILKPTESTSSCFRAISKNNDRDVLRDKEVDYSASYKRVKFEN
jgi:hypothetical protein